MPSHNCINNLQCSVFKVHMRAIPSKLNNASSKHFVLTLGRYKLNHRLTWSLLRKEVIQPHLPIRLPCYDFTPIADPTFDIFAHGFGYYQLSWCDGRCVQGPGTYSPRHSDSRLLATPASCRRVSAYNPNWDKFLSFAPPRGIASLCTCHCSTCVALDIRGMMIWRHPHLPPG